MDAVRGERLSPPKVSGATASPHARVHTKVVAGFIKENYPGKRTRNVRETFEDSSPSADGKASEIADLALYLCSERPASYGQGLSHRWRCHYLNNCNSVLDTGLNQ